ncbi:unnamed protein product [Nezara viridula]|uniref:Chaoptin n=1 Tax=Nezara viridula TaxID=85310 RepID=A0A9P0MSR2_NEZVI|nr:unnamed protein product [Nezara viridula]
MVASILVMLWIAYSSAAICQFDAQCTCTSSYPNWGQVQCHNAIVHLSPFNTTKLFTLSLINNRLDYLPPRFLQGTGLYKLILENNPIYSLHEESLAGLERSLWELHIADCKLSSIPGNAVRHLYRLRTLNLEGNEISNINTEQLRGVSASLQTLILSNNKLTVLPSGIFSGLQSLEVLDLRGNSISSLDPAVFTPAPPKLRELNLADNLFDNIPYKQLANIRSLHVLNLNHNHVSKVDQGITGIKLNLDSLLLEYNEITELGSNAMANFDVANRTSFKANPLKIIEDNAFLGCKIQDLDLSQCQLQDIDPEAFNGLENTLQSLDLSDNNVANVSYFSFNRFMTLQKLHLDDTHFHEVDWLLKPESPFEGMHLSSLFINGKQKRQINLSKLPKLAHLQNLVIINSQLGGFSVNDLKSFSIELETFIAHESGITILQPNIFLETRGIKTLDLTDNKIEKIDPLSFMELGHSLETLILMHCFSSGVTSLPTGLFKPLSSLKVLKLNHNYLSKLPNDLSYLSNLQILHAHDNKIENINKNLFKGSDHYQLMEINLSFNKITKIYIGSFSDLDNLMDINLGDNEIVNIDAGAFANLIDLTTLSLRGNKLTSLNTETFQNLPCLAYLDLAFNSLNSFNFASLDQVGTLSSLTVNVSYNMIKLLTPNATYINGRDNVYTSIKILDFSHNNITFIDKNYLLPVQHTLTHLYLSHNSLENASRDFLPEMHLLQLLDLSYNSLTEIEFDALRSARALQVILLSHNKLKDIPDDLFLSLNSLKRVDLSYNHLFTIMDAMMSPPSLMSVDLSHNDLTRAPLSTFSPMAAANLIELYLGQNRIINLPAADLFSRFENLRILDLSSNKLTEIGNSLSQLPSLSRLSIAHNFIHIGGKDFLGLEDTLEHLDLTNASISYVPSLHLPSLKTLSLAYNLISYLPPDLATNLTNLKYLDLSYNNLQSIPQFPQLKALYMAGNEISVISNTSFNEFPNIYDLDIRHLLLTEFDEEGLTSLLGLQSLHISNFKDLKNFNIPQWSKENKGLRYLHIELKGSGNLDQELKGSLPKKVRHLAFTGKEIKSLPDFLLKGIWNPSVTLTLRNTSVESLPANLFSSLTYVRNISIDVYNNSLKSLSNPSNIGAANRPGKTFLIDLFMQDNQWNCDCQLGWVETWQRKRRQVYFRDHTVEDVRQTKCNNKGNKSFLEVLKTDLECGWSRSSITYPTWFSLSLSLIILIFKNVILT